ncbi:MAG: class I SAM-dependent methyltransferase [Gordonia paraffinivorans]
MASQHDVWEFLGEADADWAVASAPGKQHGAWEGSMSEFYESGRRRVDEVLDLLPAPTGCDAVLDYGSGTGRLSFALADRFTKVTAADVSRSMLGLLADRARDRGLTIDTVDLRTERPRGGHDLAVSLITLQHMEHMDVVDDALSVISDAVRTGGFVVIDFPLPPQGWRRTFQPRYRLFRALRRAGVPHQSLYRLGLSGISMLSEAPDAFAERLRSVGLAVCSHTIDRQQYGPQATYIACKRAVSGDKDQSPSTARVTDV